jgi:phosphohistidine phosphatase
MKTLTLVRHAKSSWEFPELPDADRPLNKRGKNDAPAMGQRLAGKALSPDLIVTSPAKRALKTAKMVAGEIGYPKKKLVINERVYLADVVELMSVLHEIDNNYKDVFLVGHNPGLTDLVNDLMDESILNVPTCGVVRATFNIETWKALGKGRGELEFFDYPKREH